MASVSAPARERDDSPPGRAARRGSHSASSRVHGAPWRRAGSAPLVVVTSLAFGLLAVIATRRLDRSSFRSAVAGELSQLVDLPRPRHSRRPRSARSHSPHEELHRRDEINAPKFALTFPCFLRSRLLQVRK